MRFLSSFFVISGITVASGCASHTPQRAPVVSGRNIIPNGNVSFTSKAEGFSVWLPAQPIKSQKPTNGGKSIQYLFTTKTPAVNYSVSISPRALGYELWEANLDEMQSGMVDVLHGKLQKMERIQLNGFPGREVIVSLYDGTVTFRSRFYFTPKGAYAVAAGGYKAPMQKQAAQIKRVFDSFRILPQ